MSQVVNLVEDDAGLRRALTRLFEDAGLSVRAFESSEKFLASMCPGQRGCVVLDMLLPGLCGLALQSKLQESDVHMPIVFLTGYGNVSSSVSALKAGAFDFLEKPVAPLLLLERVRSALEYERTLFAAKTEARSAATRLKDLTPREREILREIAAGRSSKQIARHLGISYRTVEVHRTNVLRKTNSRNAVELAQLARGFAGRAVQLEGLARSEKPTDHGKPDR